MPSVGHFLDHLDPPFLIVAVALVLAVILVVKIGKVVFMAAVFGALAGGVSLAQGTPSAVASSHAVIGFGVAAVMLFLIKLTKTMFWLLIPVICALVFFACSRSDANTVRLPDQATRRGDEPPVMINPVSPVEYPPTLFARGIEGKVVLRLRVDEAGHLVGDSTRIAESSGYPALDSAAVSAAPRFRFAPALRNGTPVAATFLQPIHFRHPEAGGTTP